MSRFLRNETGAVAVEYVLITAAMGFALLAVMPILSSATSSSYSSLATKISGSP